MKTRTQLSTNFIWHSLTPSTMNIVLCAIAGILSVLVGVLQAANEQGTGFEGVNAGAGTTIPILEQFDRALTHGSWSGIATIFSGVLVLVVMCGGLEFLFGVYAGFAGKPEGGELPDIQEISERHWLLTRAYFRLVVGLIGIVAAAILVHCIHWASGVEKTQVELLRLYPSSAIWQTAVASAVWAVTYYAVVILVRLYMFRTKVFSKEANQIS